jgi:hypothetical protein
MDGLHLPTDQGSPASVCLSYCIVRVEKLATIPALDDSQFHASPVVVGDTLLLRSDKAIYAIGSR